MVGIQPTTVLAFDFGLKRIGVASGDLTTRQAHALTTITAANDTARFAAIENLVREWMPALLVVGLPLRLSGAENEMSARCRRFANQLHGRLGLPVKLADERLSSTAAEQVLQEAGQHWQKRKLLLDAVAAQIILQSYLDETS